MTFVCEIFSQFVLFTYLHLLSYLHQNIRVKFFSLHYTLTLTSTHLHTLTLTSTHLHTLTLSSTHPHLQVDLQRSLRSLEEKKAELKQSKAYLREKESELQVFSYRYLVFSDVCLSWL